jgi:hypothetical protein
MLGATDRAVWTWRATVRLVGVEMMRAGPGEENDRIAEREGMVQCADLK